MDSGAGRGNPEKRRGYEAALAEAGIKLDENLLVDPHGHGAREGLAAMNRLMAQTPRPTAVFTVTDSLAIGALRWCQLNKLRVPENVAIVGFDNIPLTEFAATPLTTVNYAVDGFFDTNNTPGDFSEFDAALFDKGGLYEGTDGTGWSFHADTFLDKPSSFYASRISASAAEIQAIVAVPEPASILLLLSTAFGISMARRRRGCWASLGL